MSIEQKINTTKFYVVFRSKQKCVFGSTSLQRRTRHLDIHDPVYSSLRHVYVCLYTGYIFFDLSFDRTYSKRFFFGDSLIQKKWGGGFTLNTSASMLFFVLRKVIKKNLFKIKFILQTSVNSVSTMNYVNYFISQYNSINNFFPFLMKKINLIQLETNKCIYRLFFSLNKSAKYFK